MFGPRLFDREAVWPIVGAHGVDSKQANLLVGQVGTVVFCQVVDGCCKLGRGHGLKDVQPLLDSLGNQGSCSDVRRQETHQMAQE